MKMLIIEDETAATRNLISIIANVCPEYEIAGTLESIDESVRWLKGNPQPDVVFMDIHLADGDAFRIFERADIKAPIIFTTAYDQYALEAFRVNSIDYLLKPIKEEDLSRALAKLRRLTNSDREAYSERVSDMASRQNSNAFLIHVKDKIVPVSAADILYAYTFDEKVTIHTRDGRTLPFEKSLDSVMASLSPDDFFRANRQFVVARAAIADISIWFGNRLSLNLSAPTPEKIVISKARVPEFKRWMTGKSRNG